MFRGTCLLQRLNKQSYGLIQSQKNGRKTLGNLIAVNIIRKAGSAAPTNFDPPDGRDYDEALKEFKNKDGYKPLGYGWDDDDPIQDHMSNVEMMFIGATILLGCVPFLLWYTPIGSGEEKAWYKREARKLLAERLEKGLPPIDINYAPKEMIEQMVPPPGDWEREWLRHQPSWKNYHRWDWWTESPTSSKHAGWPFR